MGISHKIEARLDDQMFQTHTQVSLVLYIYFILWRFTITSVRLIRTITQTKKQALKEQWTCNISGDLIAEIYTTTLYGKGT